MQGLKPPSRDGPSRTPAPPPLAEAQMEAVASILNVANDYPYLSVASVVAGCAALLSLARRRSDLPPGPKGYPIVGNLFDLPPSHVWEKFSELGKQYGALSIPGLHSVPTLVWAEVHELVRRRNRIPQHHGSRDDNPQLVQNRYRYP
jgi:hypothetical protein